MIGSAEIGEIMMRAYILRRVGLIQDGNAGSVLVGRPGDSDLNRLENFLRRNGYPYTVLSADDEEGRTVMDRFGVLPEELPIMLCPNGTLLKRPTDAEAGICLGLTPDLDPAKIYDVAVVGAGPAGLATAVYAGSEGLSVIVLDQKSFGGQAGASARIENYLGFPTGISGMALAGRAFNQALKFGVEIAIPLEVSKLDCGDGRNGDPFTLELTDGGQGARENRGNRRRRPLPASSNRQSFHVRRRRHLVLGLSRRGQALRGRGDRADRRRQFGGAGHCVPRAKGQTIASCGARRRPRNLHVSLSHRPHQGASQCRAAHQDGDRCP
jgi:thioredoxin reductase (NADPH)